MKMKKVWALANLSKLSGMMDGLAFLPVPDLINGIHLLRTLCPDDPPEAAELLDYFDSTYISGRLRQQNPAQNQAVYRRMGMSYQVEEIVVPALAHVVGSGITVDCGIMYVPNGWWKHRWATC
jgi:hypothetical protein